MSLCHLEKKIGPVLVSGVVVHCFANASTALDVFLLLSMKDRAL